MMIVNHLYAFRERRRNWLSSTRIKIWSIIGGHLCISRIAVRASRLAVSIDFFLEAYMAQRGERALPLPRVRRHRHKILALCQFTSEKLVRIAAIEPI